MHADPTYSPLPRGVFTISIDLELAWGVSDLEMTDSRRAAILGERMVVERLLGLLERYRTRATWAIVAHLLLDDWERDADGRPHPDFPRPVVEGEDRDHFFQLPATRDPAWWGRDLVERVRAAHPRHEIGSHSFCHLLFDDRRTRRAAVEADLARAAALHRLHELPMDSFVYPRNVVGFKSALRDAGVRVFRDATPRWYSRLRPRALLRGARLASYLFDPAPPTVLPRRDHGMVALGDSLLLIGRDGPRAWLPPARIRRLARRGLERAAARREVFHLWFHPSNFVAGGEDQLDTLESILGCAQDLVARGDLENRVMGEFAEPEGGIP